MSSILDVREKLGAVLARVEDSDPPVVQAPIDAMAPPMLVLGWRIPMLDTWAACTAMAHLWVLIVAGRLDMPKGYETIEAQYQRIQTLCRANQFSIVQDTGPGAVEVAKVAYLGCRIDVKTPITL